MSGNIANSRFRVLVALCLICAGLSAFFLLKGEDTTYFEFQSSRSFGTSGISALTYYLVWSESEREDVATKEGVVSILSAMAGGSSASTLPDRMERNIVLAILFALASAALGIALWVAKPSSANGR
jgi:hypothetical protein